VARLGFPLFNLDCNSGLSYVLTASLHYVHASTFSLGNGDAPSAASNAGFPLQHGGHTGSGTRHPERGAKRYERSPGRIQTMSGSNFSSEHARPHSPWNDGNDGPSNDDDDGSSRNDVALRNASGYDAFNDAASIGGVGFKLRQ